MTLISLSGCFFKNNTAKDGILTIDKAQTLIVGEQYKKIIIKTADVTIENGKVDEILIEPSVGNGAVTLNNIVARNLEIHGGGPNSIYIRGKSTLDNVILNRKDGPVRFVADSSTNVKVLTVADDSQNVFLSGKLGNVKVEASDIDISADGATISEIQIDGSNNHFNISSDSQIDSLNISENSHGIKLLIDGNVKEIVSAGNNADIRINGDVEKLVITGNSNIVITSQVKEIIFMEGAEDSIITIEGSGTVELIRTNSPIVISGSGKVEMIATNDKKLISGELIPQQTRVVNNPFKEEIGENEVIIPPKTSGSKPVKPNPPKTMNKVSNIKIITSLEDVGNLANDATVMVTLSTLTSNVDIYYTLDGKAPTINSTKYTKPFNVSNSNLLGDSIVIRAIGIKANYLNSELSSMALIFNGLEYSETATLGSWENDRTEPQNWDESEIGYITVDTKTEPNNNWYAWQGKKSVTNVGLTSDWKVETEIELTEEMISRDGIRVSAWIAVEGDKNFRKENWLGVIDWSILQFKKENSSDTAGWQYWDSSGSGSWINIEGILIEPGTYSLATIYKDGTIYQYINGREVNSYDINKELALSSPSSLIIQSYSFGESYSVTWKVPEIKYQSGLTNDAKIVSTITELKLAISEIADYDTIYLASGEYKTNEKLNINKPLTLIGLREVLITVENDLGSVNNLKHAFGIYANNVVINNLIIDSNDNAYGIHIYKVENIKLMNLISKRSKGAGLIVNGSTVSVENFNTESNHWGGVNVDPGIGVNTLSSFTFTSGTLDEELQIWSDSSNVSEQAPVEVVAAGYSKYYLQDNGMTFWTNREVVNLASNTQNEITKYFSNIQAAIDDANPGDTIILSPGNYDVTYINGNIKHYLLIQKPITLKAADINNKPVIFADYTKINSQASHQQATIEIYQTSDVTLDGLTIQSITNYPTTFTKVVEITNSNNVKVTNSNIYDDGRTAIYLSGVGVGKYEITHNYLDGAIVPANGAGNGIGGTESTISHNTINASISFTGKTNSGWDPLSFEVYPSIVNNIINGTDYGMFINSRDADENKLISDDIMLNIKNKNEFPNGIVAIVEDSYEYYGATLFRKRLMLNPTVYNETSKRGFESLETAISYANSDDTIVLGANVQLLDTLLINKSITLDLNGNTLETADNNFGPAKTVIKVTGTSHLHILGNGLIKSGTTTSYNGYINMTPAIHINDINASLTLKNNVTVKSGNSINSRDTAAAIWAQNFEELNIIDSQVVGGNHIKKDGVVIGYNNDSTAGIAVDLTVASGKTVNIIRSNIYGGNGIGEGYSLNKDADGHLESDQGFKQASGGTAFSMNQTNTINITESIIKGGHSDLLHGGHAVIKGAGKFDIKTSTLIGGNGNTTDGYGNGKAVAGNNNGHGSFTIDENSILIDGGNANQNRTSNLYRKIVNSVTVL